MPLIVQSQQQNPTKPEVNVKSQSVKTSSATNTTDNAQSEEKKDTKQATLEKNTVLEKNNASSTNTNNQKKKFESGLKSRLKDIFNGFASSALFTWFESKIEKSKNKKQEKRDQRLKESNNRRNKPY